jgi:hypothetical protein
MVWINLFFILLTTQAWTKSIPKFLTKHSIESIRYISNDGRFAYIKKRPGVLGLVSSFRSEDFISEPAGSDFIIVGSRFNQRLAIEIIPDRSQEFNILKNHKIMVVDWGKGSPKEIGQGKYSRLHLQDEWITYYDAFNRIIVVQNIITQKKYQIKLSPKPNPFYFPQVEMISSSTIVYSDINEKGYSALIEYNLHDKKSNVLYRSNQTGTHLELCQEKGYLAIGEFPYDGIDRNSRILQIKLSDATNLAGYSTIYSSVDEDLGNIICLEKSLYFVKTVQHNPKLNYKEHEAARLDLKELKVEVKSDLKNVNQLIRMDERVLIPFRGEFFVLEGEANLGEDQLKSNPVNNAVELPIDV